MPQDSRGHQRPGWTVLLIGGPSGAGKSTAARAIGQRLGCSWLQVDDFRLAFERSRVTLPQGTKALSFFLMPAHDLWVQAPERLRDGLIGVGEALAPALEVVIENHIDQQAPAIIEGDGILPALLGRTAVRARTTDGRLRAVFVIEPDEEAILSNMRARGRGFDERTNREQRTQARMNWLYGQWLHAEAGRYDLPVVEARPWGTLAERILATAETVHDQ